MKAGFHELDVDAFVRKLKALAPAASTPEELPPKCVTFARVARGRGCSVEVKVSIVRAILSGELPVISNVDGTVGGLLIPHEDFQRLVNDARAHASGHTRTPSEATRYLKMW